MSLDALVVAAHPDDAEISLGGTILRMVAEGRRVGICDLTRGEMGTRGTMEDRDRETAAANEVMGIAVRENLGLPDGRVQVTVESREALAAVIRRHAPDLVFGMHTEDLHPDHAACGRLVREAWFLAGLARMAHDADPSGGEPAHRPRRLFHYMGHVPFEPTAVIDIDDVWERKLELIRCYLSQLEPADDGDDGRHFLFGADILRRAETKARFWGERIGCQFGEPLLHHGPVGVRDPFAL